MEKRENPTKSFFLLKEAGEPDFGFTTGTCAQAASVASARMLLTGEIVPYVILTTPKGIKVCIEIENQRISEDEASCSVQKFSGSDSDVTNGIKIFSTVRKVSKKIVTNSQRNEASDAGGIKIIGGEGVGRVTLPGLDQKTGEAAINRVPRIMICDGVQAELEKMRTACHSELDSESLEVEISVPNGEEIAKQTFNPKLGIVGGISILGTSGIVEPMSEQAILDTIQVEMNVRKAQGFSVLPVVPGNYGADFLQKEFGFSPETAVHCSNFVYDTVLMAKKMGFKKMLFCGHIGKLVKVAGGIPNTHSKYGDHRMEILAEITRNFVSESAFSSIGSELSACISTEQAIHVLDSIDANNSSDSSSSHKTRDRIMQEIAQRIQAQMNEWGSGEIQTEVVIFTNEHGLLAETSGARKYVEKIKTCDTIES
ncbi:MAG: cobalamin biosynthesis protein CbiD [Treponema sp.]|nr:cobalamin biosynthesis protein CbiD [Treponema sp.]